MTAAKRLRWTMIIIALGCLAGMGVSHRLWVGHGRTFPRTPMSSGLPNADWPVELALTSVLVCGLAAAMIGFARPWSAALALACGLVMLAFDQSRLQPWFLQYMLMLALLAASGLGRGSAADDRHAVGTLRLIVVFMYVFSGLHKLNASFLQETVPLLLRPLTEVVRIGEGSDVLGWFIPPVEVLLGLGLLASRTRTWAMWGLGFMHVSILLLIGPLGINHNAVVWPWNACMIALVWVLFGWPSTDGSGDLPSTSAKSMRWMAIAMAGVAPIGGLIGWVDVYLSWGMYAGAPPLMAVEMSPRMVAGLPPGLARQVVKGRNPPAVMILDWSFADLAVAYPEERVMRHAASAFLKHAPTPEDMRVLVIPRPGRWTTARRPEVVPIDRLR